MCIDRPQDMTYSLLQYEEEAPVSNKRNSQVMKRASICEDLCENQCVVEVLHCEVKYVLG